mgnify:CR=1 FL=1
MAEPVLLYGVGATKAGTSWLYRTLADRPDCALSAVKEAHYWDTFDVPTCDNQVAVFARQRREFLAAMEEALAAGREHKLSNMTRRFQDMSALIGVHSGDRSDHSAYLSYLRDRARPGTRLIADICPSYGLLDAEHYREMAALSERSRFVYLVREPVARLWSAVRMQAERRQQPGEDVGEKANMILARILSQGSDAHITMRGDYASAVTRMRGALPAETLHVAYMEELLTDAGYADLCAFLELPPAPAPIERKVHQGARVEMRADLRQAAYEMLRPHYAFAEAEIGPLPAAWTAAREALSC